MLHSDVSPLTPTSCNLTAAPDHWADPLVYRPERFLRKDSDEFKARHPQAHMPFGAGPRLCIGYKLAMQVQPG